MNLELNAEGWLTAEKVVNLLQNFKVTCWQTVGLFGDFVDNLFGLIWYILFQFPIYVNANVSKPETSAVSVKLTCFLFARLSQRRQTQFPWFPAMSSSTHLLCCENVNVTRDIGLSPSWVSISTWKGPRLAKKSSEVSSNITLTLPVLLSPGHAHWWRHKPLPLSVLEGTWAQTNPLFILNDGFCHSKWF